jgi:trans-aconitate 2-methyltransferase
VTAHPETRPGWDAALYAENTAHHRRYDEDVLRGVDLRAGDDVLDLGCGVGDFTARLGGLVPAGRVLGVDADRDMVAVARQRNTAANVEFAVCPAQELSRAAAPGRFAAVVSVAMLHWAPAADHPGILGNVARALRPGGVFRAQFGGHGQVAAVQAVLDGVSAAHGGGTAPWFFPTPAEYRALLAGAGLDPARGWVRLITQRRDFPTGTAFLGWLRSQALNAYEPTLPPAARRAFRAEAEERALVELPTADGSYDLDFIRLDLLAHAGRRP